MRPIASNAASHSARRLRALSCALAAVVAAPALAKEIHLDCARENQSVMVDIDTDRRFMQLMWSEGVAEEYKEGDSYMSGPDNAGRTEKVTFVMSVDKDVVTFGQDRICVDNPRKVRCEDKHIRNLLDVSANEMKYLDGDTAAILHCKAAPPGRRF